ncbi:NAD(P)H-hydrate dehydratase [Dinoroseobacter sp. S375]|uniref:NAD(P)H-hydrate dehydratase n=1 Tax=Dinoroseobacter sp. S375 TaxID=3415136 RepID=UPI003C7ABA32
MPDLLTAAQMRAIEQAAIDSGAVTGLELMERAGRGVVAAIFEEWPELAGSQRGPAPAPPEYFENNEEGRQCLRAMVLCGPGNNGGDGFVVARLLKEKGWEVEVFLYGDPEKLPPDARTNYDRWRALGQVAPLDDQVFDGVVDEVRSAALCIDALFGTGLARPFLPFRRMSMALTSGPSRGLTGSRPKVVAVDIPSGLCADSGRWLEGDAPPGVTGQVDLTVSFHTRKLGHCLEDGPASCRKTVVVDIGLTGSSAGEVVHLAEPSGGAIAKGLDRHKYSHGHALVLSGPMGRSGAARLAARGALRVGAGLVTVGAPGSAMMECATQLTAIMLRRCKGAEDLAASLADARLNALCLGPGFGVGEKTRALVLAALAAKRATVLDADALTSFADDPQGLFSALHPDVVLTPHGGEFAGLFPDIAAELAAPPITGPAFSKVDATREAAVRAGCTVLFKGPDTVIAAPDGSCAINAAVYERAAPWLATAGSGDVLAGIITGLLARGFDPQSAAETGAWLHVDAARAFGPGLIAEDLPEMLPQVFRDLGLQ